jgi:hypothetical protein
MRWVVAMFALVCGVRAASAGEVGVVASGDETLQPAVTKRFEKWLRKHGHDVVPQPLSQDATSTLANCFTIDDLVCARGVFDARSKTETLVYVGIAVAGKNVTFNVYWFHKGKDAVGERRVCEKCQTDEWHGLTDKMLERLAGEVIPPSKPASRLWPAVVLGGGVATMGAGAIFLYYGSLGGPDQKYIYPNSTPIGIAFAAVGLGATIGGTIWLIQTGSSQSGPVASATRGGAYLGWAGHF